MCKFTSKDDQKFHLTTRRNSSQLLNFPSAHNENGEQQKL